MFTIETQAVNLFWSTKEIIEEIINQSAMHVVNKEPIIFEQSVLSEDNGIFFNLEIKNAMSDLVVAFIKLANIVDESIHINSEKNGELQSGFTIKQVCDNGGNMIVNPARLTVLDMKCRQYIIDSILLQWAKINNIKPFIDKFSESQFSALNEINNNLFHLRILSYKQSYTFTSTN